MDCLVLALAVAQIAVNSPDDLDSLDQLIHQQANSERKLDRGLRRWALHDRLRDGFAQSRVTPDDADQSIGFMREFDWLDSVEEILVTDAFLNRAPTPIPTAIAFDIPLADHELVEVYIDYFTGRGRKHFEKWLARAERYRPMMEPILEQHGLPRDVFYLAMIESGLSPKAFSVAAASGYWQFIRSTAELFGMRMDHWVDERRDFVIATHAACRYLKRLHQKFGDWHLAWASYNAGEGRIGRALRRSGAKSYWELVDRKAIPKETRHYVPKIIAAAIVAKNAERYGFLDIQGHRPFTYDELRVDDAIDLKRLARSVNIAINDLRELNPSLLHDLTPPRRKSILRVPVGYLEKARAWIASAKPIELMNLEIYRVRKGDTLSAIARRFEVSITSLKDFNALRNVNSLRVGKTLRVPVRARTVRRRGKSTSKRTLVASSRERKHVVSTGETLWSISRRYGCSVSELKQWNKMNDSAIYAGKVLKVRR